MDKINFTKLLVPYAEPTEEGVPQRTTGGQRLWLIQRKRIPPELVEAGMQVTYARMARGKTFKDGDALDQYLLKQCMIRYRAQEKALDRLQQSNINKVLRVMKPTHWYTNVAWAATGAALMYVATNLLVLP